MGCQAELGASLGRGASLRLKQPPALPGRSPPGAAFHLSVNFCTKNKTKPKSVSCSTTRSAAKPFWGHGQPGPLPTAAPSAGRAAAGGRDWGDAPRRAASAPPSLPPPRIPSVRPTGGGSADSSAHAPPSHPPTSGAARGCIADPAAPTDKSDAASRRHKEEQRPAAPRRYGPGGGGHGVRVFGVTAHRSAHRSPFPNDLRYGLGRGHL